ncbi:hypothetical protein C7419_103586, partial [Cupriavidus plantarum]
RIFRANRQQTPEGRGYTQFGRALFELNIDILCANSSQAEGRVERMNGTLQDRLVKELRLRGISSMATPTPMRPPSSPTSTPGSLRFHEAISTPIGRYTTMRTYGASFAGANGARSPTV